VLPPLDGRPIRVVVKRSLGPYHASTSIPRRVILLDAGVLRERGEFERILVHELFHFVWVRLSNASRRTWEDVLQAEIASGVRGELGWSSEWRKNKLASESALARDPRWRRYACESFCDTAAWIYSGVMGHDEFTLGSRVGNLRRRWFAGHFPVHAGVRM
jgi:hypothetical protein